MTLPPITPESVFNAVGKIGPATVARIVDCFSYGRVHHARARRVRLTLAHLRRRGAVMLVIRHWELVPVPADTLETILLLVDLKPSPTEAQIKKRTHWERFLAEEWAGRTHLRASDNPVRVPPVPEWLKPMREGNR